MLKQTILGLTSAVAVGIGFGGAAEAVQITLGNDDYEISTVSGTYNDLLPQLSTNPWFTSFTPSESAVIQANLGPSVFFAFDLGLGNGGIGYIIREGSGTTGFFNRQTFDPDYFTTVNTFAVAELIDGVDPEPVPEPVSGLAILAAGAVVAGGALKQRTNIG